LRTRLGGNASNYSESEQRDDEAISHRRPPCEGRSLGSRKLTELRTDNQHSVNPWCRNSPRRILPWPPMPGPKGKLVEGKLSSRHGSACGRSDERGAYGGWSESSDSSGQGTSSICGFPRAGATGGPGVGSWRCSRIALTALRSMRNASTTRRPPRGGGVPDS